MELVSADPVAMEARLSRLAFMPADPDAAIAQMKDQVRSMWAALGGWAAPLVPRALHASALQLPGLRNCSPDDLDAVLGVLDRALPNHHPEEIRVASFALLCGLMELVREELGADQAGALLAALERSPV